ncbi:hypothetical protein [Clostridium sp.]|uniref:hypothetical protein n=1 Tax=Clostridium sp. TaxID=1506 RepID=UPI002617203A
MDLNLRFNYKEIYGDLDSNINEVKEKNESIDAFCFNCEKGFSVNDGGYFIIDEPYCSLECVIEAIIKEINTELMIKRINKENIDLKYLYNSSVNKNLLHLKNHYNLDSAQKERIIEFTKEKGELYLVEFLEKVLYDD